MKVFGGLVSPIFAAPAAPLAYLFEVTYPSFIDMRQTEDPILNVSGQYNSQVTEYFISIRTLEDLRQQSFWECGVRSVSSTAVFMMITAGS